MPLREPKYHPWQQATANHIHHTVIPSLQGPHPHLAKSVGKAMDEEGLSGIRKLPPQHLRELRSWLLMDLEKSDSAVRQGKKSEEEHSKLKDGHTGVLQLLPEVVNIEDQRTHHRGLRDILMSLGRKAGFSE